MEDDSSGVRYLRRHGEAERDGDEGRCEDRRRAARRLLRRDDRKLRTRLDLRRAVVERGDARRGDDLRLPLRLRGCDERADLRRAEDARRQSDDGVRRGRAELAHGLARVGESAGQAEP